MRTEEQVLNDFKKLGYKEQYYDVDYYEFVKKIDKHSNHIVIDRNLKLVGSYMSVYTREYPYSIDLEEHKLLHELFECWGWL